MKNNLPVKPQTNLQAVERYLLYNDISMNADQEQLLSRISFADEKIRSRKHKRDEIIQAIVNRWGVSKWRAEQDLSDANKLFGKTRKIGRDYVLAQHIESMQLQIQAMIEAKAFDMLPSMNNALTAAIKAMPPDEEQRNRTPTKIIFVNNSMQVNQKKSIDELLREADELINTNAQPEYVEFTDVPG